MLANRVRKTAKHRRKWARRNDIHCYRVYDKDIPELPFVIDRMRTAHTSLCMSEDKTATLGSMDIFCLRLRLLSTSRSSMSTQDPSAPAWQVSVRGPRHEKRTIEVRENGLKFIVN